MLDSTRQRIIVLNVLKTEDNMHSLRDNDKLGPQGERQLGKESPDEKDGNVIDKQIVLGVSVCVRWRKKGKERKRQSERR